jgi:hypothetical protein
MVMATHQEIIEELRDERLHLIVLQSSIVGNEPAFVHLLYKEMGSTMKMCISIIWHLRFSPIRKDYSMSNNNNLITEISALVLAVLLVLAGALLLYLGKISYDSAIFFFISALGLFGFNSAWKAPSPAQQSQLLSLVAEKQAQPPAVIHNYIPSIPALSATAPQAVPTSQILSTGIAATKGTFDTTTNAPLPSQQFVQPMPFPYAPSSTYPQMPAVQP